MKKNDWITPCFIALTAPNNTENFLPMIQPKLNISDVILIKNGLQAIRDSMIPELQDRIDYIISELLRAELEVKNK